MMSAKNRQEKKGRRGRKKGDPKVPGSGGPSSSRALIEERLLIVQALIMQGRGSGDELVHGLAELGHDVPRDTAYKYAKQVKDRILREHEELRSIRKAWYVNTLVAMEEKISSLLKDFEVAPTWHDRINVLRLLKDAVFEDVPVLGPVHPDDTIGDDEDLREKSSAELHRMLVDMLDRSRSVITDKAGLTEKN